MRMFLCSLLGIIGVTCQNKCESWCPEGQNMISSPDCVGCLSTLTGQNVTYATTLINMTAAPTTVAVSTNNTTYPPSILTSSIKQSTFTTTLKGLDTTSTMLTTIKENENFPCCYIITNQYGKKPVTKVCPCPTTTNKHSTDATTTSTATPTSMTTSNLITTLTTSNPTSVTNPGYTSTKSSSVLTTTVPTYTTTPLTLTSTDPIPILTMLMDTSTNPQLTTTVDTTTQATTDSSTTTPTPVTVTSTSTEQQFTTVVSDLPSSTTYTSTTSSAPITTKSSTKISETSRKRTTVTTEDTPSTILTTTKPNFDTTAETRTQSTSATTTPSAGASNTFKTNTIKTSTLTTRPTSTVIASSSTNAASTTPNVVTLEKTSNAPLLFSTSTIQNMASTTFKKETKTTVEKDSDQITLSSTAVGVTDVSATTTTKPQTSPKATTTENYVFSTYLTTSKIFKILTTPGTTTAENAAIETSTATSTNEDGSTTAATQRLTKAYTTALETPFSTVPAAGSIGDIVSTSSKKPNPLTTVIPSVTFPKHTTVLKPSTASKTTTDDTTATKVLTTVNKQTSIETSTEASRVTSAKTITLFETTSVKPILSSVSPSSKQTSTAASPPGSTVQQKTTDLPIEYSTISSTEKSILSTKQTLSMVKTTAVLPTTQRDETVSRLLTTTTKSNPTDIVSSKSTTLPSAIPVTQNMKTQSTEKETSLSSTKSTNVKTTKSATTIPIILTKSASTIPSTTKSAIVVPTTNVTKQSTVITSKTTSTTTKTIATSKPLTTTTTTIKPVATTQPSTTTTTIKPVATSQPSTTTTTTQPETTASPCSCANSGVCNENGTCSCPDGYFGENCDYSLPSPSVAAATTAVTVALAASQSSSSKLKYLWPRYSASVRSPTTPHEFFRLLATYWLTVALGVNSMFGIPSSADIKNLPKCSMAYLFGTGAFFFSLTAMLFEAGVDALTLSGMRFNAWTRPAERRPRCFPFWPTFSFYVLVGVAPTAGLWLKHWTACVTPRSCIGSLGYIYGDYDQDIKNASWLQLTITVFYVAIAMTLGILAISCNKFDVCRCRRRTEAWSINPYIYGREIWPLEANAFLWLVAIQPLLFTLSWISYIYVNDMKTSTAQWINLIITSIYSVTSTVASALTTSQELSGTVMSALTTLPPRFMGIMPTLDHVSLRDKDDIKKVQMRPEEWEKCKQKELNGGPVPVFPVRMEILPAGLVDYMCHLWTLAYIRLRDNGASSESAIATLTNAFLQQKPDLRNINVFTFALLFSNWVNEIREKDSNSVPTSLIRKSRAIIDRRLDINKPPPMLVVKEHRNDIVYRKRVPHLAPMFNSDENIKKNDGKEDDVVNLNEIHPSFVGPHRESNAASALVPRNLVSAYFKDFSDKQNR